MQILNVLLTVRVTPEYEQAATMSEVVKVNDAQRALGTQSIFEVLSGDTKTINFGQVVTGQTVLIQSDRQISATLNGSLTPVLCRTLLLDQTSLASLAIANPGSITAKVRISILGS